MSFIEYYIKKNHLDIILIFGFYLKIKLLKLKVFIPINNT
jgi:hypothetical protein